MTTETKKITEEDLGHVPFGAPGEREHEQQEAEPNEAGEPKAGPSSGEAAIGLAEMSLGLAVTFASASARVPLTETADLGHLSEQEKALLRTFAPAVEPYLERWGANSPHFGAIVFLAAFGMIAFGRLQEIRARAPKKKRSPAADDLGRRAFFGQTADAVGPETVVEDVGFPPPFHPGAPLNPVVSASPDFLAPAPWS